MEEYKKSEIAIIQLNGAINQIKQHNFVSALTLAGAANEILVQLCRLNGLPFTYTFNTDAADKLGMMSSRQLHEAIKDLSNTRNTIKHHNKPEDEIVRADFFVEASWFINSAMANYETLFNQPAKSPEIDYYLSTIVKTK